MYNGKVAVVTLPVAVENYSSKAGEAMCRNMAE